MPTYAVRDLETNDVRLVEASHPATAIKHVVNPRYVATLATAADGVDAGKAGRGIEAAGSDMPPPEPSATAALTQEQADNHNAMLDGMVSPKPSAPSLPPTLCGDPAADDAEAGQ